MQTSSAQAASPAVLLLVKCLRLVGEAPPQLPAAGAAPAEAGGASGGDGGRGDLLLVSMVDVSSGRPPVSIELPLDRWVW